MSNRRGPTSSRFHHATQRLRWPMLVFICLLGMAVSFAMAHHVDQSQQQLLQLTFENARQHPPVTSDPPPTTTTTTDDLQRIDPDSPAPWIVLFVGLTLTALVTLLLGGMIRSADRMAEFAASREVANLELRQRIRERTEAEEALASANRELRQVNADMERFVGAVSHDLKSPLVAAEMLLSVMLQAVAKGDLQRVDHTARQIRKACARMRRIIDDLLEHQKAGWSDLRSEAVDMVEVALHVLEEHRDEATDKNAHIHLEDDLPTLRVDRGRITALLDNLVSNALKYATDGPDPVIIVGSEIDEHEVRLFVRDHGPGIPEDDRDRMWELFQRLSRDEDGTGIGLAIVQRVAEAHGGHAWVQCPPPEEGGGSIFYVTLPKDRLIQPSIAARDGTATREESGASLRSAPA